jgi:hypothetical protein
MSAYKEKEPSSAMQKGSDYLCDAAAIDKAK